MELETLIRTRGVPGLYQNGFVTDSGLLPYFSLLGDQPTTHGWSDELAEGLEEHSKSHFIDQYNRKLALDALAPALTQLDTRYLDVGCSSGYMIDEVKEAFPNTPIYGADYVRVGLLHCHKRHPEVPLFRMDLLDCPFETNSFAAITCLNVLEHIEDDAGALTQLRRILKPGGRLALTVPAGKTLCDLYDDVHFHYRRYRLSELESNMRQAGFKLLRANYFGCFLYPAFYLVKKRNQRKYNFLSVEEKRKVVFSQIISTRDSHVMNWICQMEAGLGKKLRFPFGIRAFVDATKL
jgi:ubiquinone/menaquinone biosynthesis C-methylase UbiE